MGAALASLSPRSRAPKSIAVLPFADMSPEKDQDYFCEGMAEEIINAITKVQALRVASRSSSFAYKGKNQDIRKVGEQLGVSTVLEGSVRKAGKRLRITVQLINVADGYHLWSERYDRELEDVFAVQDEIAENIVRALRIVLTEQEKRAIDKPRTGSIEAYEFYLRGRQGFNLFREKSLQFARRMFARAIEIDPNFAPAYAGTADCSSFLFMWWDPSRANLEEAQKASRKALELAPEMSEAHAARGLALTLSAQYAESEKEFLTAMGLDPKSFEAHYFYARACFQQGRYEEAAAAFERAATLRPEDYQTPSLLGLTFNALGRTAREPTADAAQRQCRSSSITSSSTPMTPGRCISAQPISPTWGERKRPWTGPSARSHWTPMIPRYCTTWPAPTLSSVWWKRRSIAWRREPSMVPATDRGWRGIQTWTPCVTIPASPPF